MTCCCWYIDCKPFLTDIIESVVLKSTISKSAWEFRDLADRSTIIVFSCDYMDCWVLLHRNVLVRRNGCKSFIDWFAFYRIAELFIIWIWQRLCAVHQAVKHIEKRKAKNSCLVKVRLSVYRIPCCYCSCRTCRKEEQAWMSVLLFDQVTNAFLQVFPCSISIGLLRLFMPSLSFFTSTSNMSINDCPSFL